MSCAKRKSLSIAEKAEIIQRLKNGEMNTTLAKEFGVPHSSISSIKKNKQRIEALLHTSDPKRKRIRSSTHNQVDQALLQWTKLQTEQGISVTGPMLFEKADFFGTHLNIPDYKCSMSWINRFKIRHNIVAGKIACASPIQENEDSEWLADVWPNLRALFSDDEIFYADETELSYESEEKTSKLKANKRSRGKSIKSRLTVMVAANMNGTVKKNLLVIGKSKCIENLSVPVDYESNYRAYMTSEIFIKWYRAWDDYLARKNKKILLLVDNSPAHLPISDLKSVTFVFLPPSMTSTLRSNQGIIQALEANFQKTLALKIAECHDTSDSITMRPKITLRDAIIIAYDAWNKLTPVTIKNCFKHAGFVQENVGYTSNSENCEEEDVKMSDFDVVKIECVDNPITSKESYGEDLPPDVEIKTEIEDKKDDVDDGHDHDDEKKVFSAPNVSEALIAAEVLNVFVDSNFNDDNLKGMMSRVHDAVRDAYYRTKHNEN